MPNVTQLEDLENVNKWKFEFELYEGSLSDGWIHKREEHVHKLVDLFNSSLLLLNSDLEIERERSQTRLKFAMHRLGQLGFGEVADKVVGLIVSEPWWLSVRRACHDLVT